MSDEIAERVAYWEFLAAHTEGATDSDNLAGVQVDRWFHRSRAARRAHENRKAK